MRFVEYTPLALRTESKEEHIVFGINHESAVHAKKNIQVNRLIHASLGLSSEFAELKDDLADPNKAIDYFEELGDFIWYLNLGADALDTSLDELIENEYSFGEDYDTIDHLGILAGHLADKVKRARFYKIDLDFIQKNKKTLREEIYGLLSHLKKGFLYACEEYNFDPEEVMDRNIAKLSARYPDKFSTGRAVDRDLAAESKALKGDLDEPLGKRQEDCDGKACDSCQ